MTNIVILDGRLTDDPDIREARDGLKIATFTLAVNRPGNSGETDFVRCKAFRQTAEAIGDYCHKGTRILVNGSIQTGKYTNRDGKTVFTTDIVLSRFDFLEKKEQAKPAEEVPEYLDIPEEDGMSPFR